MGNGSAGWIAAGAALLVGFVLIELRSATPLLPMSLLLVPRRVIALLAIALTAAGMTVDYFILALYLQEIRAYSPLATSAMFALPALVLLAAGPLAGRVRARLGAWPLLVAGQALAGAGCLLLAGVGHGSPGGGQLLAGLVVFALGAGMSFSLSMVL